MVRPTIQEIRNIGNVTQLFRWNMIFSKFPSAIAAPPEANALNLRCESIDPPKATGQSMDIEIRGHKVRQPGKLEYSSQLNMTFIETIDNVVHKYLKAWRESCWATGTGVSKDKKEVEAEILLQRLNNNDKAIWEYKIIGCFLEDYEDGGTLDGATSEALKPSFVLSYDYFEDREL